MGLGEITVLDYGGEPLTSGQEIHRVKGEETHLDHSCSHQGPSQERRPELSAGTPPRKEMHLHAVSQKLCRDEWRRHIVLQPSFPDIYFSLGLLSLFHTPLPHEWLAIKQYLFCFIATCIT